MSFGLIMKLYHVLFACVFIGGMLAQNMMFIQAARSNNVHVACTLLRISDMCEKFVVVPGAFCLMLLGFFTAWGQGWSRAISSNNLTFNWLTVSILLFTLPAPIFLVIGYFRHKAHQVAWSSALQQERITPELRRVFRNKLTISYRVIEFVLTFVIMAFMVLKPF